MSEATKHDIMEETIPCFHPIEVDSDLGREFGLTSDKWRDISYLWRDHKVIIVSMIAAVHPGQGDFSQLIRTIREKGYDVEIPTPVGKMELIVQHWKMKKKVRRHPMMGPVEIWYFPKRRRRQ